MHVRHHQSPQRRLPGAPFYHHRKQLRFFNTCHRCRSSARRVCCSCSSSATLLSERRTSSANGACGLQERHDPAGMRLLIADHRWRSRVRRSTAWGSAAGRTAHPQEPMPCLERVADRRREQHSLTITATRLPEGNLPSDHALLRSTRSSWPIRCSSSEFAVSRCTRCESAKRPILSHGSRSCEAEPAR